MDNTEILSFTIQEMKSKIRDAWFKITIEASANKSSHSLHRDRRVPPEAASQRQEAEVEPIWR